MAAGTTSGTYGYAQTVYKIFTGSLRLMNVIGDEETPTAAQMENLLDTFNSMVKGWQASGIHLWAEVECILFLQPGQPQYQLGPGSSDHACAFRDLRQSYLLATAAAGANQLTLNSPVGVLAGDNIGIQLDAGGIFWATISAAPVGNIVGLSATLPSQASQNAITFDYTTGLMRPLRVPMGRRYVFSSKTSTPLITMARLDYDYLPNQLNTGTITQFFYDPQTGGTGPYTVQAGLMNVWPAPADSLSGMRFVANRPLQDVSTLASLPDFPQEWIAPLRWGLAKEAMLEYSVTADRAAEITKAADQWFLRCSAWDKEPESVFFGVASRPGYRR